MQYNFTEDRKDLFTALCKAQASMGAAVKDSKNPHFRHGYASLTAVLDAVVPVLNAQGITVLQLPHLEDPYVKLTTVLAHTSGQMLESTVGAPMDKKHNAQAVGSAITYLRRYALQSIMGLPVEDDDGNAASRRAPQQQGRRSLPSTQDWGARIAAELESAGLTVEHFNTWADKRERPRLGGMTPEQKRRCLDWLADANGLQVIKATITEQV